MVDMDITLEYGTVTVVSFHGVFHGHKCYLSMRADFYNYEPIVILVMQYCVQTVCERYN